MRSARLTRAALPLLLAAACSSAGPGGPGDGAGGDAGGGALAGGDAAGAELLSAELPGPVAPGWARLHFGPADRDDPEEISPYLLPPGGETVDCLRVAPIGGGDLLLGRHSAVLGPGSHHLLLNGATPGAIGGDPRDCAAGDATQLFALVEAGAGQATRRIDAPTLVPGPSGAKVVVPLPGDEPLVLQAHFVNPAEVPIVREAFLDLELIEPGEAVELGGRLTHFAGLRMALPPRQRSTVRGRCEHPGGDAPALRILELFGHVHAHGRRVSAWHVDPSRPAGEERRLIYETYEWSELERYRYGAGTENPAPDPAARRGGAASGEVVVRSGESVELECEFDNDGDRPLTFTAETFDGEMCGLIGTYAPSDGALWYCAVD
ncbi:MAG: hypothetical protein FJ104_12525 [Deltaproteobacteria bacterium]|nr:hypothetical protein [Deltaproteobacteria bacterium]